VLLAARNKTPNQDRFVPVRVGEEVQEVLRRGDGELMPSRKGGSMGNRQQSQEASPSPFPYEVLTTTELAQRLKVKESWIVDQSKRSRTADPIPVSRLGKHRRYLWGSPELNAWLGRRSGSTGKSA
jgi:hypothetical protein